MKIGDRVYFDDGAKKGTGTVVAIENDEYGIEIEYGIKMDTPSNGHRLGGRVPNGHGWWFKSQKITTHQDHANTTEAAAYYHALIGVS